MMGPMEDADDRDLDGWIQTVSGRRFWPLSPREEDLDLGDIAHALSMKCRFTGHTSEFYSVAQHAVLLASYVPAADVAWGLMHDATEAYLPDVARPVKKYLPEFRLIEDRLMRMIARRYGLPEEPPPSIKVADLRMLATERRDLMTIKHRWTSVENVEPYPHRIRPWSPAEAKKNFLTIADVLFPNGEKL